MTTPLVYPLKPPNAVDYVISHLRGLPEPCEAIRLQTDAALFRMVNRLPTTPDERYDGVADDALVSIHSFGSTYTEASDMGDATDARMCLLVNNPLLTVTLFDGTPANAQYVQTVQRATHVDYEEPDLWRFVSRYKLGFAFV